MVIVCKVSQYLIQPRQIWAVLAEVLAAEPVKVLARLLTWDPLLLSFPWLIVLPVLAYSCAVARAAPVYAQRYYFYCTIYPSHNSIHESSMLIVVVLLALCVLFAVWALALFFSLGRSARRQLKIQTQLQRHAVNGDILLRVALYLVWIIMTLVVACVEYRTKTIHKSLAILTATDSLSSFVIFATQREMLSVWGLDGLARFFGRCSHSHAQSHSHSSTLSSRSLDEGSSSWLSNSRGRSQHSLSLSQSLSRSYSHSQSHPQLDTEGVNRLDSSDRRQFSKLSSIEDVDGSTIVNSQRGAQDSDGNEVKGREFGQAVSVVHKCTPEQPEHQKFPTLSNIDQAQSQTHNHTPNQTHTFTHSQPQYTHNRQNSSNTTCNSHYSHVPPRKPVPSFASYELPAVALTSPSGSIYGRRSERQWSNNQSHNSHNSHSHPL